MLVLSRRANQSIVIGSDIVVRVLDIRGDQVRIGVEAPRHVAVHREEVAAEIRHSHLGTFSATISVHIRFAISTERGGTTLKERTRSICGVTRAGIWRSP